MLYITDYLCVGFINFPTTERFQIRLRHSDGGMPHRLGDNTRMNFAMIGGRRPSVTGSVRAESVVQRQPFAQKHELLIEAA